MVSVDLDFRSSSHLHWPIDGISSGGSKRSIESLQFVFDIPHGTGFRVFCLLWHDVSHEYYDRKILES